MQNGRTAGQPLPDLPSLSEFTATLRAILESPYPPRNAFIHAIANASLLEEVISSLITHLASFAALPSAWHRGLAHHDATTRVSVPVPEIQHVLPQAVVVDCAELASTKALYGRVLNALAGWGTGSWDDSLQGVLNWDGRQRGYSIVENITAAQGHPRWRVKWDHKAARDIPTSNQAKGGIVDRKDESLSAFIEGLKLVFSLGCEQEDAQDDEDMVRNDNNVEEHPRPRFVILLNADRLPALESLPAGHNEGTLLASFMRLGELTGKPIVPILVSSSEWLLLRPSRGATEPALVLEFPALKKQDMQRYIQSKWASQDRPSSSSLSADKQASLLSALVDLVHQTYEPYLGDELADYLWLVEKLWPEWKRPVEMGAVEATDINRLVALCKNALSQEIEGLGELRPLLRSVETVQPAESSTQASTSSTRARQTQLNGKQQSTPTKSTSAAAGAAAFYATAGKLASPSLAYSPGGRLLSPTKRGLNANGLLESVGSSITLAGSLSLLARYLLIAAFLASSNPSKKDLQMLATSEDDLALSKRKKRGGAIRKTPVKRGSAASTGMESLAGPIRKKDTMVPQRLLGPKPFPVERMIAITETILPVELRKLAKSPDILREIATLTNLRLLLRTSTGIAASALPSSAQTTTAAAAATVSLSPFDRLEGIKLKCSTSLELDFVEQIGKSVGFRVADRLWETFV